MSDDPHAEGGPPTYVQPGARTPTHAERSRTLVARHVSGMLSTLAVEPAGHPFGSVATYALDGDGAPLVLMSAMAEHATNLDADPRCSLLVTAADAAAGTGRLAGARATLVGDMRRVPDDRQEAATGAYRDVHPDAFWAEFPDFSVRRLEVTAIRYVRGFGEMSWVDAGAYRAAEPDPLAGAEDGIVTHMNEDHTDSMRDMVAAYLDVDGPVTDVEMTSCDRYGFELRLTVEDGDGGHRTAFGRIGFDEPLGDASRAREAMVRLTRRARD